MIGEILLNLRKKKGLSQEEVAEKLNVTRQTVSKWETEQSSPDFDKIVPLCELYEITPDELLTGNKREESINHSSNDNNKRKKSLGISIGILLYFLAVCFIMVAIPVLRIDAVAASSVFLLICGIATVIIIYVSNVYKTKREKKVEQNPILRKIYIISRLIMLII